MSLRGKKTMKGSGEVISNTYNTGCQALQNTSMRKTMRRRIGVSNLQLQGRMDEQSQQTVFL